MQAYELASHGLAVQGARDRHLFDPRAWVVHHLSPQTGSSLCRRQFAIGRLVAQHPCRSDVLPQDLPVKTEDHDPVADRVQRGFQFRGMLLGGQALFKLAFEKAGVLQG